MEEKHIEAQRLVDAGETNAEIQAVIKEKFGSGISTSLLAKWRGSQTARKRETRKDYLAAKRAFIKEKLSEGESGYVCQRLCKEKFGSGVGYTWILEIQAELKAAAEPELESATPEEDVTEVVMSLPDVDSPDDADAADDAIVPVEIPPEMIDHSDLPDESGELAIVRPPGPNGTLVNMKAIQVWMVQINAENLNLTRDGKLSVYVRHEFDLGGIE